VMGNLVDKKHAWKNFPFNGKGKSSGKDGKPWEIASTFCLGRPGRTGGDRAATSKDLAYVRRAKNRRTPCCREEWLGGGPEEGGRKGGNSARRRKPIWKARPVTRNRLCVQGAGVILGALLRSETRGKKSGGGLSKVID